MYRNTATRPKGLIVEESDDGRRRETDTLQCCHCGGHFRVTKVTTRLRACARCWKCGGPTCGRRCCLECVPYEMQWSEPQKAAERMSAGGIALP